MTTTSVAKRILWVDDDIELLHPHCVFLQHRGYPGHAISNLCYKFGEELRAADPAPVFSASDPKDLRLPEGSPGTNLMFALADFFLVYPPKLREYQKRYRGAFLHGGILPEEMIVPVATLRPRSR